MLFSKNESLEDSLVGMLLERPLQVKELHARLVSIGPISARAVYKAVHALIEAGVVIKVGKRIWIDREWLKNLQGHIVPVAPLVSPGERISYTFTSLGHLDAFWKTIVLQLDQYERDGHIFFYNPHNFWAYMPERKESEDAYYAHFPKERKHAYFTVGGITNADMEFKRGYQNDFLQVDARPIGSLGRVNHLTVLGDVIIGVRLPTGFAQYVDAQYQSNEPMEKVLPGILVAAKGIGKVTLVVEHNALKAQKLRKLLSQNFFFRG